MLFRKKTKEVGRQTLFQEPRSVVASNPAPRISQVQRDPPGLAARALLAEGINILGCLQTDGEVQVDGEINGDVRCAHLTIGKSGTVNGDISAGEAVIRGNVKGAIRAQRVIIQEGAHVEGDICHDTVAIEEGAYFKGSCTPNDTKETDAPERSSVSLQRVVDDCEGTA